MSLPIHAAWFAGADALLLAKADTGGVELLFERNPEAQGDTLMASAGYRRYWTIDDDGIAKLHINAGAQHGFFLCGEHASVSLNLEAKADSTNELLLVLYAEDSAGHQNRLQFLPGRGRISDAAELHVYAREALLSGPHQHIRRIWRAPCSFRNGRMTLAPACPAWPHGSPRGIEVQPLRGSSGPRSRIELVVRHDEYRESPEARAAELSPADDGSVILLVWRSLFAGRLARLSEPSPFVREFQDNVRKQTGRTIKFGTAPQELAAGVRRPVARGSFFPSADIVSSQVKLGDLARYAFEGPCDMYDVVMLGVPSSPEKARELTLHRDFDGELHILSIEGIEISIVCWRAELDRLTPIDWDDLERETHGQLKAQLIDELRKLRTDISQDAATAGADDLPGTAPLREMRELRPQDLFAFDDEHHDAVQAWFATLATDSVRRLWIDRLPERPNITNIARFLPLDVAGVSTDPDSWSILERSAADLYELLAAIQHLMAPSSTAPKTGIRSDPRLWATITDALERVQIADKSPIEAVIGALSPGASGIPRLLDPGMLKSAAVRFGELYKALALMASARPTASAE